MNIENRKELKAAAARRRADAPQLGSVVLTYCALVLGSAAAVTVVNYLLGLSIDQLGGLGNMGIRTILSTVQTILPMGQSLFAMALELGFLGVMLRTARGQFSSKNSLKLGFDRFWPLLRLSLLKGGIFLGLGMATAYAASIIFLATPLGRDTLHLLLPAVAGGVTDPNAILADEAMAAQLLGTMTPMLVIWLVLYLAVVFPIAFQYRMAEYVLIDKPALGALAAMRESRLMMRRRKLQLLKLDVSLWWYYLALLGSSLVAYADLLLPMLGVSVTGTAAYFMVYALQLGAQFAVIYWVRSKAEVVYAVAYDAIRPRETNGGAVLGNIFQI